MGPASLSHDVASWRLITQWYLQSRDRDSDNLGYLLYLEGYIDDCLFLDIDRKGYLLYFEGVLMIVYSLDIDRISESLVAAF